MRWLITGGCGFIGTNLIRALQNEGGHYFRVLDNLSVGTREALAEVCDFTECVSRKPERSEGKPELIIGDILDRRLPIEVSNDIDVIVHLAANTGVAPSVADPRKDCDVNVIGTLNCLEAARINGIKRFIFASSGAPVGAVEPPIHEELAPRPVSPYGASKLAGEGYCSAYWGTFNIETVALRFGNVYGPGSMRKNSVVAKFLKDLFEGKALQIFGDGNQTRDFIFVEDLVNAIIRAARVENIGGELFQIATSRETTVNEVVDMISRILPQYGIQASEPFYADVRQGDVRRTYSNTAKASQKLGWTANYALEEGLRKTIEYFAKPRKHKIR